MTLPPQGATTTDDPRDPITGEPVETTATTESTDATTETPQQKPGETKAEYDKRIDELTKARRTAERERDTYKAELDALKRKEAAGARPEPPDLADFTDADGRVKSAEFRAAQRAHEDKLFAWREAQKPAAPAEPSHDDEPPELVQARETFVAGVDALRAQHPDIDEVINRPVFTPDMRAILWESEIGPAMAYHLGQHQADALRIGRLPPVQMARELGKLEARLAGGAAGTHAPRTVSGAPDPITPVAGNGTTAAKDPEKMSVDEWMTHEKNRTLERLKKNPLGL